MFGWTGIFIGIFLASQILVTMLGIPHRWTLRTREKFAKATLILPLLVLVVSLIELQAFVIGYFLDLDDKHGFDWFSNSLPKLWAGLMAFGVVFAATAGKLSSIVRNTIGDTTWTGILKRVLSKTALYLAAMIIPLLLWGLYIFLSYWGIRINMSERFAEPRIDVDRFTFSSLKKKTEVAWDKDVRFSPYLIVNTAVNLENSKYLNRRGRNADSFVFTPLFMGSEATGFARSQAIEAIDKNVNLGTAMATSGAATSANMRDQTVRALTFSLAALNIRLGYWLPNPNRLRDWGLSSRLISRIGLIYYLKEAFGWLNEETRNVYLTDGGHFDNLGLYELLKRRCRLIIAMGEDDDGG